MIEPDVQWEEFRGPNRKGSFESAFHGFVEQLEVAYALAPDEVMPIGNLIESLKEIRCGRHRIINEVTCP